MNPRTALLRIPRPRSPYVLDGFLALSLSLLCLVAFFTAERTPAQPRPADALGVVLVALATASLTFRRRWPVAVFLLATGVTMAIYLLDYPDSGQPLVVLITLYTLASRCDRRTTLAATVALLLLIVFFVADASGMDNGTLVATLAVFTTAAVWGDRTKVRDAYAEQLELRAAEKERERLEAARRAVGDERLRIARELHDVVAHAMSVVVVQSGVGAHVIDSRPEEAKRILETISNTSRDSLNEMRRLLGVLRTDPSAAEPSSADPAAVDSSAGVELAPAPGLGRLDVLVGRLTGAGVPVETSVQVDESAVADLPPGVDLAAYRIVQEALTNVLKHAGPARVCVLVRYAPGTVHLEVLDDGRGAASVAGGGAGAGNGLAGSGSGHGLVGMRERAALYGGALEAGPRVGGGYRVAATLRYAA